MSTSKKRKPERGYRGRIMGTDPATRKRVALCDLGYFPTIAERRAAIEKAKLERPWEKKPVSGMTGDEVADAYLADYAMRPGTGFDGRVKKSSVDTETFALRAFRRTFGQRSFAEIERQEAKVWARSVPAAYVPPTIAVGRFAEDELEIGVRNPFRGLTGVHRRSRGRADQPLPDLEAVLKACAVHGDYATEMIAYILVPAFTAMRPCELWELRWCDIDLDCQEATVSRRIYERVVDAPKNGRSKTVYLSVRVRDALLALAAERMTQDPMLLAPDALVFLTKGGCQFDKSNQSNHWRPIRVAAGLPPWAHFYLATKHFCVNLLWKEGASERAIVSQTGWSEGQVKALLRVYGHQEDATREELRALDQRRQSEASVTQT